MQPDLENLIYAVASEYRIDPEFFKALVIYAGADPNKVTPGTPFPLCYAREYADKNEIPYPEEAQLQSSLLGLTQLPGVWARRLGFERHLRELLHAETNLRLAAQRIQGLFEDYGYEADVIAAYHTGTTFRYSGGLYGNERQVDEFFTVLRELRKLK